MVMTTFTRLGLFKSAEEAIYSGELHVSTTSNEDGNYVPMLDGSSPSLVPVPVPVPIPIVTEFIKKRLPVVLFSNFLQGADESTGRILHNHINLHNTTHTLSFISKPHTY